MSLIKYIGNIGGEVNPDNPSQEQQFRRYTVWMWAGFLSVIIFIVLLFQGISWGIFGALPTFVELESPKSELASEVYAADGSLLGKFYIVDRTNVNFESLPKHLTDALVATEDARFYTHSGIDFVSILRVFYKTILLGQDSGGGSTLTQQLAKNLFHNKPANVWERLKQKLKEWIIAIRLERSYTKEEIMTMYLNTVPFGNNAHGIKAASQTYFSVNPDSLKVQESAVLVGMLKGSTLYNPQRNPERSRERRNTVIGQLYNYGKLSAEVRDSLLALPLDLKMNLPDYSAGLAPYFREFVKADLKRWFKDNLKIDGSTYDIYRDGLKIYTTIDPRMQRYAEESVHDNMKKLQQQFDDHWKGRVPWEGVGNADLPKTDIWYGTNELIYRAVKNSERYSELKEIGLAEDAIKKSFYTPRKMTVFNWKGERDTTLSPIDSIKYVKTLLHTGFMAIDPSTGYILAWVGGIDFKYFKYDNARPTARRQVGSTFKPFVYTVAIDNGWSPCRKVPNLPVTIGNWSPDNASNYLAGQMVSLKVGLAHSINRITAYLMKELGPDAVLELVHKMGIDEDGVIKPEPGICLGTPDLSVFEMVGAYSTFANKGFYSHPLCITRIEDKNGNVIRSFTPTRTEVISEQAAYAMINMLKGVTDFGTGIRIRNRYNLRAEIAGKTGTTNDNSDGWYIGMTPKIVAGTWVGGDEKTIHFRNTKLGSGSNMALPIYADFMHKVYADTSLHISQDERFVIPTSMNIELDCSKYDIPPPSSNSTIIVNAEGDTIVIPATDTTPVKKEFDYNSQFD